MDFFRIYTKTESVQGSSGAVLFQKINWKKSEKPVDKRFAMRYNIIAFKNSTANDNGVRIREEEIYLLVRRLFCCLRSGAQQKYLTKHTEKKRCSLLAES